MGFERKGRCRTICDDGHKSDDARSMGVREIGRMIYRSKNNRHHIASVCYSERREQQVSVTDS